MNLSELRPSAGSKTAKYRKGRGEASGNGKTAGYGEKGQKARSGAKRPGFEGGQMPLYRRIPKRGFKNYNTKDIVAINVCELERRFQNGDEVTVDALLEKRAISRTGDGVKILGNGELTKKLTVKVNAYSAAAKEKIEKAGGTAEVI
ncbi:MAG: 50S ribosomal protein L15 [Lachnospiraceae bacterium]|nr:50S ribosomal protein L15 [Lachnospiraceae bacterium]